MNQKWVLFRLFMGIWETVTLCAGIWLIGVGLFQTDTVFQEQSAYLLAGALFALTGVFQVMIIGSLIGEQLAIAYETHTRL